MGKMNKSRRADLKEIRVKHLQFFKKILTIILPKNQRI